MNNIKLILLDRDGVINFDSPDYIKQPDEWQPIPGAIEAIVLMQQHATVAVCTNQSGVARGLFDVSVLGLIHDKLNGCVQAAGGTPLDIFFCPHSPDAGCGCRKPKTDLLTTAMSAYSIEAAQTVYAGDSEKDLLAAENAGCKPALVLTGNGRITLTSQAGQRARIVAEDLANLPAALNLIAD